MREILFRGKDIDNGIFVTGYLIGNETCKKYITLVGSYCKEVIPETVGQYTGLTDKNGKMIFEGDILDCGDRIVFTKWNSYCGTWDSMFIKYSGDLCSNGITPAEWKYRAVVIGNIYDNPELLKGE